MFCFFQPLYGESVRKTSFLKISNGFIHFCICLWSWAWSAAALFFGCFTNRRSHAAWGSHFLFRSFVAELLRSCRLGVTYTNALPAKLGLTFWISTRFMDASCCCTFQALAKMLFPPCAGITFLMGVTTAEGNDVAALSGVSKMSFPHASHFGFRCSI